MDRQPTVRPAAHPLQQRAGTTVRAYLAARPERRTRELGRVCRPARPATRTCHPGSRRPARRGRKAGQDPETHLQSHGGIKVMGIVLAIVIVVSSSRASRPTSGGRPPASSGVRSRRARTRGGFAQQVRRPNTTGSMPSTATTPGAAGAQPTRERSRGAVDHAGRRAGARAADGRVDERAGRIPGRPGPRRAPGRTADRQGLGRARLPAGDPERQLALASVDHPRSLSAFRDGHDLLQRSNTGAPGIDATEQLRQAMLNFRTFFDDLVGLDHRTPDRRSPTAVRKVPA